MSTAEARPLTIKLILFHVIIAAAIRVKWTLFRVFTLHGHYNKLLINIGIGHIELQWYFIVIISLNRLYMSISKKKTVANWDHLYMVIVTFVFSVYKIISGTKKKKVLF